MANPQPTDAHGIISHNIQESIIIRDFTEQQLKIIYLIIRLSWGCGIKAWQYNNYKDFEAIGIYKSDIAQHLNYLKNNKVIDWIEKYNLLIFNKDYDQWKIPINKKSSEETMDKLVHESLKKANEVRILLTMLGKIPNEVRKNPERLDTATPTNQSITEVPKESIKESIINSSNSSNNAHEEDIEIKKDIGDLKKFYETNNYGLITEFVVNEMGTYLDDGLDVELIIAALGEGVSQGKTSWAYAKGILNKCVTGKITSLEQFKAEKKKHDDEKIRKREVISKQSNGFNKFQKEDNRNNFDQREYDDDYYKSLYKNAKQ